MKSLHSGIWLPFMHLADWDCVIKASQWETAATQLHPWYDWVMHEGKLERICQKNKKDGKRHESERCMTNKDIIDMERRREKPDLFSIFLNRSISRLFIGQHIFHMLHTCTEKEKNTKGHRSLAGKRWKKSSISPKRTLPTHNRKWDTLYYRVPKYHFLLTALLRRTLLRSVSLCFLLLKRDLKIGPTRLKRKKVQDLVWLQ